MHSIYPFNRLSENSQKNDFKELFTFLYFVNYKYFQNPKYIKKLATMCPDTHMIEKDLSK